MEVNVPRRVAVVGATTLLGQRIVKRALARKFIVVAIVEDKKLAMKLFEAEMKVPEPVKVEEKLPNEEQKVVPAKGKKPVGKAVKAKSPPPPAKLAPVENAGPHIKVLSKQVDIRRCQLVDAFSGVDIVVECETLQPSTPLLSLSTATPSNTKRESIQEAVDDTTKTLDPQIQTEAVKVILEAVVLANVETLVVCGMSGCLMSSAGSNSPRIYEVLMSLPGMELVVPLCKMHLNIQAQVYKSPVRFVYQLCPPNMIAGIAGTATGMVPSINISHDVACNDVSYEDVADVLVQTFDSPQVYNRCMVGVKYCTFFRSAPPTAESCRDDDAANELAAYGKEAKAKHKHTPLSSIDDPFFNYMPLGESLEW